MGKISTLVMYFLWIVTIIFILLATFTNFQHLDLNIIAGVLLFFAALNSFFMTSRSGKPNQEK